MDISNEGFNEVLVFCAIIWTPLGEDGIFELSYVDLESQFVCGVGVPISVSGLVLAGAGPSIFLHLGFVPFGDVLLILF